MSALSIDGANGNISITYTSKVDAANNVIQLVPKAANAVLVSGTIPTGPIVWSCNGTGTTVVSKYRPSECR